MKVGDFGIALANLSTINVPISPSDVLPNTFTRFGGGNLTGYGEDVGAVIGLPAAGTYAGLNISSAASNGHLLIASQNVHHGLYHGALGINAGDITRKRFFRVYSQANATVDSNGFIKAASPIVELYADRIELNDEAKQQAITFEKLGVGDYLIKGSTGFAQEGWYIETPKDANGNLLVAVVYGQLENGDISVKAYDYMLNNKGRIVADTETPLDIPENRWIDIRLQELPQPEIEVTDDPEQ